MAIVLKDRVKETSTSTGTGTITLLGAAAGYQGFSAIGNGNTTYYAIVNPEDGTWEVGTGTYTSSGSTLSRTTVFESSNAGALVDFGVGTKDVFVTYPAERAIYEEPDGQTLIDGGPITVLGVGVTSNPSLEAELGKFVGNVDSFGQVYNMNQNDGSSASADFVVYNDLTTDGFTNFTDMGINSSNYTSVDYPIFTPGSGYFFHDGDNLFIGTQTANKDVVLFAGGVDTSNEAVRIKGTDQSVELASDLTVAGTATITGAAEFQSTVLLDADPTLALQAATKQYVDNATSNGFHVHTPVLVATTGNLTATYNQPGGAGVGVGATLTNSGTQVALEIDGVSMSANDRVLVWQQTTGTQNGIYTVTTVGDGSTNWVLTRATDADEAGEGSPDSLGGGDYFFVSSGATLGFFSFVCTNTDTITFGTTAITFTEFSQVPSYIVNAPLNLTGNTLSLSGTVAATNGGTGTNTVTTGDLLYGSATNTWSKLAAGSAYKSLVMNAGGTNVEWNAVALNQSGAVSGSLGATNGGTGQNAYATGDMLYSDNTNSLAKLSGNTSTTKQFLTQTGTGSASQAPAWGTISGSDVTSAVSSATNVAGGAANQIVYQTGSGATGFVTAPVSSGTALTWNGSSLTWASAGGASITDDTTTNTTYYPVWANATSGTMANAYVSSGKLGFNPSTGTLSATTFSGAWSGIPSGTALLFYQAAAPTGWTKSVTDNDKAIRVVSGSTGGTSGGSVAFSTAFASKTPSGSVSTSITGISGSVGVSLSAGGSIANTTAGGSVSLSAGGSVSATTLDTTQIPAHSHSLRANATNGNAGTTAIYSSVAAFSFTNTTGIQNTGGGGSHTHGFTNPTYSFSGSAHNHTLTNPTYSGSFTFSSGTASSSFTGNAINLAVQYCDVIICTKD